MRARMRESVSDSFECWQVFESVRKFLYATTHHLGGVYNTIHASTRESFEYWQVLAIACTRS